MDNLKEAILEGNKLMAEFLGYTYYPFDETQPELKAGWWKTGTNTKLTHPKLKHTQDNFLCRTHKELRFFNDWNLLMDVWNKTSSYQLDVLNALGIVDNSAEYTYKSNDACECLIVGRRIEFFHSLVSLIKYINKKRYEREIAGNA